MTGRRSHARVPFVGSLHLRCWRGDELDPPVAAHGVDVSVGGVAFTSAVPLANGDRVCLALARDAEARHFVHAVVRHATPLGASWVIGVERRPGS